MKTQVTSVQCISLLTIFRIILSIFCQFTVGLLQSKSKSNSLLFMSFLRCGMDFTSFPSGKIFVT